MKCSVIYFVVGLMAGCTTLTKVDWNRIPTSEAGGGTAVTMAGSDSSGGGPSNEGGAAGGAELGGAGAGGQSEGGEAGEGGQGGQGGATTGGGISGGGSSGLTGNAGTAGNAGTSGNAGTGGMSGGGGNGAVAPKCNTYPATPASVDLAGKIVMFDSGPQAAGVDWGGRDGVDAKCQAAATSLALNKAVVHAFLAASTDDMLTPGISSNYVERFAVPTVPTVVSPLGIKIADSAGELSNFKLSLICAGVVHADVEAWLSGVKDGGVSDPLMNCSGWTLRKEDLSVRASVGLTDTTNTLFHDSLLADHWVSCSNASAHLLCLGWDP